MDSVKRVPIMAITQLLPGTTAESMPTSHMFFIVSAHVCFYVCMCICMLCVCMFVPCVGACVHRYACMHVCSHVHGGPRTSHFSDASHFIYLFIEAGSIIALELTPFYLSVCVCT